MASNQIVSSASSSPPRQSSSHNSISSQSNFSAVAKAFNYIPLKLDTKNYIFWKAQILVTVRAFDLVQFLNKTSPPKCVPGPTSDSIVNSEYLSWIRLDQMLLGWLFSIINEKVLAQVIHLESSTEVWIMLENLYARQTLAKSF